MIEKHSVALGKHKTSVSLEPEFWQQFQALVARGGGRIGDTIAAIDATREKDIGRSSAIRLWVLAQLINTAVAPAAKAEAA